jgi:hypothetical protein
MGHKETLAYLLEPGAALAVTLRRVIPAVPEQEGQSPAPRSLRPGERTRTLRLDN